MIYSIFDFSWMMPKWMQEMLACWKGWLGRRCNGEIWQADLVSHVVSLEQAEC